MTYREAREKAGLTMQAAADALNVSKAAVSIWETGKGDPLLENIRKMATLYGVSVIDLMQEKGEA